MDPRSHALEVLAEIRQDPPKILDRCEIDADLALSRAERDLDPGVEADAEANRQIVEELLPRAGCRLLTRPLPARRSTSGIARIARA